MPSTLDAASLTLGPLGEGIEHVGWSEDGYDGPHLLIIRDHADPDGYCVVVNNNPHYGGVLTFEVDPGETRLTFSAQAAQELGLETVVTIRYDSVKVDPGLLRDALERLFDLDATQPRGSHSAGSPY
jgi:hypothetical protein